jgi:hypothetical protein
MQNLAEAPNITDAEPDIQPAEHVVLPDDSAAAAIPPDVREVADPRGDRDDLLTSGFEGPAEREPTDTAQKLGSEVVDKTVEVESPEGSDAGKTAEVESSMDAEVLRHGFLSFFANRLAETDPDSAELVRQYRDTPQIDGEQQVTALGSKPDTGPEVADASLEERVFGRTAFAADSLRQEDEGEGKSSKGVTSSACGKMSDLVGVQDPHSAFGGLFHDLGALLPWGKFFETDYDRAVNEFLAQHPNTFF